LTRAWYVVAVAGDALKVAVEVVVPPAARVTVLGL
jgi:hypothetical protein